VKRGNRRPPAARMIYAASERCADLLYATGFLAPDPFLWLSVDGQAMAVLSELEIGRARKQMRPGVEVLSHTEAGRRWRIGRRPQGGAVALAAACAKSCGVRKWSVPADFPLELARRLARRGVEAEPVREFFPERRRKREEEIEHIRAGVRLAELGLARAM